MIQQVNHKQKNFNRKQTKISNDYLYFIQLEQKMKAEIKNLVNLHFLIDKILTRDISEIRQQYIYIIETIKTYQDVIQKIQKQCYFFINNFIRDADQYLQKIQNNKQAYQQEAKRDSQYKILVQQAQNQFKKLQQEQAALSAKYQLLNSKFTNLLENLSDYRTLYQNTKQKLEVKKINKYALVQQLQQSFLIKRKLNNQLQQRKGNVRVYCRIRPLQSFGIDQKQKYYQVINDTALIMKVPKEALKSDNHKKQYYYNFQMIFDNATQTKVFNELAQLVQSCLDGKNVCIFAYGQTGSGKTYTMEGGEGQHQGIIPRSVQYIFNQIHRAKRHGWTHQLLVSVQEVYMQTVRDLLCQNNQKNQDATEILVQTPQAIQILLNTAKQNRKVAETQCNQRSSRSHCIFTLKIKGKNDKQIKQGSLNLIDLAGSERITQSKVQGQRLKQTMSINKSLTQLSTVITSLAKKQQHIPYRNSKLTFLLQPYLSGDSKTLMMVNISPLIQNHQQSTISLRFAETVRQCIINKN